VDEAEGDGEGATRLNGRFCSDERGGDLGAEVGSEQGECDNKKID
jgi:hypothetical protein